jgi:GNAT superfamily N-acetyltransferase
MCELRFDRTRNAIRVGSVRRIRYSPRVETKNRTGVVLSQLLVIRSAKPSDAATIAVYMLRLAHETENIRLDPATVELGVKAAIDDPAKGRYFIADLAGEVVGCLMVTHEWSDWRNCDMWWIQSVYVHADHRSKGVFKSLYNDVITKAHASGVGVIRLYVEKHNTQARSTYSKLGMSMTEYDVMEVKVR